MADTGLPIKFYKIKEDKNHVVKTLENEISATCYLKDDTSILTPTIVYGGALGNILGSGEGSHPINYCHIPRFDRYYFVTDVRITASHLAEIDLKCDVLMSHLRPSIGNTPLLASRWQNARAAQQFVPEERLNLRTKTSVSFKQASYQIIVPTEYFILCTAGSGELPQT